MKRLYRISRYLLIFICFLILGLQSLKAQENTATVRGFVYNKETGEPILFTTVVLKGTRYGAVTDGDGYFSITKVQPGNYVIATSYLGFDTLQVNISLKAGQILNQKLMLRKKQISLNEIKVSSKREENKEKVNVAVTTVTSKEIAQLPSIGGEPDIAQYLQVLPGVVFTGDQGGQLYIRGGSPVMNKVMLDGMIIYNPFHSIGLFSVFETDIIKTADVHTGGFNAEYGGRISAVMDVSTKDGNQNRLTGKIGASPFMSRLLLEGPLGKHKSEDDFVPTFLFSAKTSYLDQTSKVLYSYADTGGLPFSFTDLYGKVSFKTNNGSKLNLFGFNFKDRVNFRSIADIAWNSVGAGTNFIVVPGSSTTLIRGNFGYSAYDITQQEADGRPRRSSIGGFNGGLNFSHFNGRDELSYGVELVSFSTDFTFFNSVGRRLEQKINNTEIAGFVKYRYVSKRLVVEPGFRIQYYPTLANTSFEPRFGLKFNLTERIRLKAAGGMYSQNLIAAASDRDVVNLFYGFLAGPDNLPKTFKGEELKDKLQRASHLLGGIEYDLTENIEINSEVFLKDFNQMTNLNRDKIYDDLPQFADKPEIQRKDFIIETGKAYGADFRVKYERKRWYLWTTYSLTYVTRDDGVRQYAPNFDRRHNVNLVATYTAGKKRNWEISARWNYGSGFPFTQTQGFFEQVFINNLGGNVLNQNGQLGIAYGELNGGRLPDFHRLDMGVKYRLEIGKQKLECNFSVTNTYNRENIFYFDRIRYTRVNQLPILPSFGITYQF